MNILVIRFRQMGDAVLSTVLLNTLRKNFPEAQIHFVLNERIAPLFEGHPSIDRIITFSDEENHHAWKFVRKVWRTVHQTHYDVIIDMRSTANTMLFALLSPASRFRIGVRKGYTRLAYNRFIELDRSLSMIDRNLNLAKPLEALRQVTPVREFTLQVTEQEKKSFGSYLTRQGVDLSRPVLLANVTAKLASKVWAEDKMVWVLEQFIRKYPDWQVIFNYAPGKEEENARRIWQRLGSPSRVFIDVQARSSRELVAMGTYMTLFFGNEGGARHIMHAVGCPSLVVCAPGNDRHVWIPQNDVPAEGVDYLAFADAEACRDMTKEQKFGLIEKEGVWERLQRFIENHCQG